MYEKVSPSHPDKIADRIAGAIVDMAYSRVCNPTIAVEVLAGHDDCFIIVEKGEGFYFSRDEVYDAVKRITKSDSAINMTLRCVSQDAILERNQSCGFRCGDNGIFKGIPLTEEERKLSNIAHKVYERYPTDGKYLIDGDDIIICQSNADALEIHNMIPEAYLINPLGYWTGGIDVDTGATNRKIYSDLGSSAMGGGMCGKDLSKADVSVSIYAFLKAQETGRVVELSCSIGDTLVDNRPYSEVVEIARDYIKTIGGFEKLAEWGLV